MQLKRRLVHQEVDRHRVIDCHISTLCVGICHSGLITVFFADIRLDPMWLISPPSFEEGKFGRSVRALPLLLVILLEGVGVLSHLVSSLSA